MLCSPNDGFVRQLELFEMLEYRADAATLASCRAYRNWCIESGKFWIKFASTVYQKLSIYPE
jgi:hypothetical protein